MALNYSTNPTFSGRITAPDADYPYGSSKDETSPGANDGMPYIKQRSDDVLGFQQWLLTLGGVAPSGNADTVRVSDYGQALANILSSSDKAAWPTISNAADADHDITFSVGRILAKTGGVPINLTSGLTKQIDAAWSAGDSAGGLFSGTVAADTTYHCFLIVNDSDGSIDAGFDTDLNAANIPAGYTAYRRIHDVATDGSANIKTFTQQGDRIVLETPDLVINDPTPGTSANLAEVAPTGALKIVELDVYLADPALTRVWVSSPSQSNTAPDATNQNISVDSVAGLANVSLEVLTDSSGQIRYRSSLGTVDTFRIRTNSWVDDRSE